jgi:hypothetical protein
MPTRESQHHSMTDDEAEPDWTAIRRRQFIDDLLSSQKWFETAAELQAAADVLKPRVIAWWDSLLAWQRRERRLFLEHGCHRVYMMLSGFVVENLAKGALVPRASSQDHEFIQSKARLPRHLVTHNLRSLVKRMSLSATAEEQELLHRMTRMVKWDGRYPVASGFDENLDRVVLDDGTVSSATWVGREDVERIDQLLDRIREHLGARRSYRIVRDDGTPIASPGA